MLLGQLIKNIKTLFLVLTFLLVSLCCTVSVFATEMVSGVIDPADVSAEALPWGAPPEEATNSGDELSGTTDFFSQSDYQNNQRAAKELRQLLKLIYQHNPDYLPHLAMFRLNASARLTNSFIYNRGGFFIGTNFWNALQTPDARAFMVLNAITWKKHKGPDKVQRVTRHSAIGSFPGGIPMAFATFGISLPYNVWATHQACHAYPKFLYTIDQLTLEQVKTLGYDQQKAMRALDVLAETQTFAFYDQTPRQFYASQAGQTIYNPSLYRVAKRGYVMVVPKPETRIRKLTQWLEKTTPSAVSTNLTTSAASKP
jgi:hypothetical protein